MESAREKYRSLVRDLGPALARLGLTKVGRAFEFVDDVAWMQLGLQKSSSSGEDEISFAVNASFVPKIEWHSARRRQDWLPVKPNPNDRYPGVGWTVRLSDGLPGRGDKWWSVTADTVTDPIVIEIEQLAARAVEELLRRRDAFVPPPNWH